MQERVQGRASGVGSWPGTDPLDAARTTLDELADPHVPYLPELPGRGPGADMLGRSAGLLVDLPVDLQPSGWRLVDHPGRDVQRARAMMRQDLDALAEATQGYSGPLKLQVAGPWTLAAGLWLPRLERALADPGACRDIADSLAEAVAVHIAEIRALVPDAAVVLQVDEPGLPGVLQGRLRTASGFGRLRAVDDQVAVRALAAVIGAAVAAGAVTTVVHCCAADVPVALLVRAGAGAVSLDVGLLGTPEWEAVASAVEAGVGLWAGAVPTSGAELAPDVVADRVWTPWRRMGLAAAAVGDVVVTPTCGLSGASPERARARLGSARRAAAELAERAQQ